MAGDHLAYILEVLIGFSSGDCDGNYRGLIWWFFIHTLIGLAVWIEALSCKKKKSLRNIVRVYTLNKIIKATLLFLPPFFIFHKRHISLKFCSQICVSEHFSFAKIIHPPHRVTL